MLPPIKLLFLFNTDIDISSLLNCNELYLVQISSKNITFGQVLESSTNGNLATPFKNGLAHGSVEF